MRHVQGWDCRAWVIGCVALLAAGCGDDGAAPIDAGGEDGDVGSDAGDGGAETASLTFEVLRQIGPDELEPAAGARFAFYEPGGERVEQTVPDDGMVTVEGIDWTMGTAAWTVYLEGHVVSSAARMDAEAAERARAATEGEAIAIALRPRATEPKTVEISGTATNMADATHALTVSATAAVDVYSQRGPDWSLHVLEGVPFTLVANERHFPEELDVVSDRGAQFVFDSWVVVHHEGVTSDTTIDIDMSDTATVETFSGSYPLPDRPDSEIFSTGRLFLNVRAHELSARGAYPAVFTKLDIVDGTVEYEGEQVALTTDPDRVVTQYSFSLTSEASVVFRPGFPEDGSLDLRFASPAEVTTPSFGTAHPVHDTIRWRMHEDDRMRDDLFVQMGVFDTSGERSEVVWLLRLPPGTTEAAIPELPTEADPATVFTGDVYDARVQLCGRREDLDGCSAFSTSPAFEVVPPGG